MKNILSLLILCAFATTQANNCPCYTSWSTGWLGCHSCPPGCRHEEISGAIDKCHECSAGTYQPNDRSTASSCQTWTTCSAPRKFVDNANQGSTTTDRECDTCADGRESSADNQLSCSVDIDGCVRNNGNSLCTVYDSAASCVDVPAPGDPNPYTCTCSSGFILQGGECVDVNSCTSTTCRTFDDGASCVDLEAPLTGYSCTCSSGYTFVGTDCVDIDECALNNPCDDFGDSSGTCFNKTAPLSGYTCSCGVGYESKDVGGIVSCHDINSCIGNSCAADGNIEATCYDSSPPSLTYTCGCTKGYSFNSNTGTCEDTNDCVGNPCSSGGDNDATCTDMPPSSNVLITCSCSAGFEPNNSTCVDIDRCASNPCIGIDVSAECFDAAAPDDTYSCTCSSDRFSFDGTTCVDNDFCVSDEPCKADGDVNATCLDAPWDANITHTCSNCSSDFTLTSDSSLCAKLLDSSKPPINFDDGSAQALIGGAVLLLILLLCIVCWYRRRVKKSIEKSEKVLRRAEMELSSTSATRDFDEMEMGGGVVCDLESTVFSSQVKALEEAKSRLELENAALRRDNLKHKQKLEKQSLSKMNLDDEVKRSTLTTQGFSTENVSEGDDVWEDDDL